MCDPAKLDPDFWKPHTSDWHAQGWLCSLQNWPPYFGSPTNLPGVLKAICFWFGQAATIIDSPSICSNLSET